MRLILFLAVQTALRSPLSLLLLVLAVMAGVTFQIPNAANLEGYTEELLRQGLARATGHVLIVGSTSRPLVRVAALSKRLRVLPYVRGVTPRLLHAGVLYRAERYQAIRVVGLDPSAEQAAIGFCDRIATGRCMQPGKDEAMLGGALAETLKVKVGDTVRLVAPHQDLGEITFLKKPLRVVAVLKNGGSFSEDKDLFLPRDVLSGWLDKKDEATLISLQVDHRRRARRYARALAPTIPDAKVLAWNEANAFVANAIAGNRAVFAISLLMVIVAVGLPVLALLYIHVLGERKQIATLAALGFGRLALFGIYLTRAALVGLVGVGLGVVAGLGLCAIFDAHPIFDYDGFVVRPLITAQVVLVPALTVFAVTLVAGLAPALKASRANPSTLLREQL